MTPSVFLKVCMSKREQPAGSNTFLQKQLCSRYTSMTYLTDVPMSAHRKKQRSVNQAGRFVKSSSVYIFKHKCLCVHTQTETDAKGVFFFSGNSREISQKYLKLCVKSTLHCYWVHTDPSKQPKSCQKKPHHCGKTVWTGGQRKCLCNRWVRNRIFPILKGAVIEKKKKERDRRQHLRWT